MPIVDRAPAASFPRLQLLTMAAAIVCIGAALLVSTDDWTEFFAHPLVDEALTRRGAAMWRAMMVVMAAGLIIGPMVVFRAARWERAASAEVGQALSRKRLGAVAALVAIALVVRLSRIGESFWYDEIASWMTYNGGADSWGAITGSFLDPINHVLHTLLNRWSTSQWMVSTISLEPAFRLPALMFSLLAIPAMYALARSSLRSERAGLIAAALAAIVPVCVLEGVEARGYAQMIFFSAMAMWLFIVAFEARCRPGVWLLYALCCALGVWSQFVTAWVAIGHGAWLTWRLIRHREDRRVCVQGMIALALAGFMSIALYSPMIPGMLAWRENFIATDPNQPRLLSAEGLHGLLQLGGSWYWWAALPGLAAFVTGAAALSRQRQTEAGEIGPRDVVALALLGLPLMVLAVALSGSWLYARFMLFAVPGALLMMTAGIDVLWTSRRAAGIAALATMVVVSVIDLCLRPPKQPLRDAMVFIEQHLQPGDRALEVGVAHAVTQIYRPHDLSLSASFRHGEDLAAKLDTLQPRWVIVEYPRKVDSTRYTLLRDRGYVETARFDGWADWIHGDVVVFEWKR